MANAHFDMSGPSAKRRLKPGIQSFFYHARQPALVLLAGSIIALAINFTFAQVNTGKNSSDLGSVQLTQEPGASLEGFSLETDPKAKTVKLVLKRGDKNPSAIKIQESQHGSQYSVMLDNTQLSQSMVDNGLPVVIDNHNKLIARAVPGKRVTQSRIIIPNMPSSEPYNVLVYEQTANQSLRLLNSSKQAAPQVTPEASPQPDTVVTSRPLTTVASRPLPTKIPPFQSVQPAVPFQTARVASSAIQKPAVQKPVITTETKKRANNSTLIASAPLNTLTKNNTVRNTSTLEPQIALRPPSDLPSQRAIPQKPIALLSQANDPVPVLRQPVLKLEKPEPRPAIEAVQSHFNAVLSSVGLIAHKPDSSELPALRSKPLADVPLVASNPKIEPVAMAQIAQPVAKTTNVTKPASRKPIQITESHTVAPGVETPRPAANTELPALVRSSKPTTEGAITYIPKFSGGITSKSGASSLGGHGPLWNPYVVKTTSEEETTEAKNAAPTIQNYSVVESAPPRFPSVAANTSDPLWYLHQLPNNGATVSSVPLQQVPDLNANGGLPAAPENPTLSASPAQTSTNSVAEGAFQIDNRFLNSVRHTFAHLPVWVYIIFGLFFGGIGLFATLGAMVLMLQLWQHLNQILDRKPIPVYPAIPASALDLYRAAPGFPEGIPPLQPQVQTILPDTEPVRFKDVTSVNPSAYLNHQQNLDQHQVVKQAVKKSVLLHFPSHRAGSKSKNGGGKKASNFVL